MSDQQEWLITWFASRDLLDPADVDELVEENYFEVTPLESLDVFELVDEIEEHFGMRFTDDHFQERRFSTISGLATMITELMQQGEGT